MKLHTHITEIGQIELTDIYPFLNQDDPVDWSGVVTVNKLTQTISVNMTLGRLSLVEARLIADALEKAIEVAAGEEG